MQELFPIAAGVVIAVLTQRLVAPRRRLVVMVALAIVFGFAASLISGELEVSWGVVPVDVALVLLAAAVTMVVGAAWERRTVGARGR